MSIHSSPFTYSSDDQAIDPAMLQLPPASFDSPAERPYSDSPTNLTSFWSPVGDLSTGSLASASPLGLYQPHAQPLRTSEPSLSTSSWPAHTLTSAAAQWQTATPQWAAMFDRSMPPPPPNTAAHPTSALPYTSLSPSPAMASDSPLRPKGPVRGFSATYPYRSTTMTTGTSTSWHCPATPHSASSASCPYPSPGIVRRPSAPMLPQTEAKRVFHPSPASSMSPAIGVDLTHLAMNPSEGYRRMRLNAPPMAEMKAPRFRPTRDQLEILIAAYEENKNPDAQTREALAKRLGSEVRPKTLQIWFQNRRSKARANDREMNIPKPLHMHGRNSPSGRMGSAGGPRRTVKLDALRALVHDDDPELLLVPITVFSISSWTRFLTPGSGLSSPDLGCSISFTTSPVLSMYIVHTDETFRITVPIDSSAISNLHTTANHAINVDALAVRFDLAPGSAVYASWMERDGECWRVVGDFTSGDAGRGGRCELTGDREILVPAFSKVQDSLTTTLPTPSSTAPMSAQPMPSFASTWRYPNTSTSSMPLSSPHIERRQAVHSHQRQRSFSAPNPLASEETWSTLTSPVMVIPPMESTQLSGTGTTWTFPVTALQTPAYSAREYQSSAMLQKSHEVEAGGSGGEMRMGREEERDVGMAGRD